MAFLFGGSLSFLSTPSFYLFFLSNLLVAWLGILDLYILDLSSSFLLFLGYGIGLFGWILLESFYTPFSFTFSL